MNLKLNIDIVDSKDLLESGRFFSFGEIGTLIAERISSGTHIPTHEDWEVFRYELLAEYRDVFGKDFNNHSCASIEKMGVLCSVFDKIHDMNDNQFYAGCLVSDNKDEVFNLKYLEFEPLSFGTAKFVSMRINNNDGYEISLTKIEQAKRAAVLSRQDCLSYIQKIKDFMLAKVTNFYDKSQDGTILYYHLYRSNEDNFLLLHDRIEEKYTLRLYLSDGEGYLYRGEKGKLYLSKEHNSSSQWFGDNVDMESLVSREFIDEQDVKRIYQWLVSDYNKYQRVA